MQRVGGEVIPVCMWTSTWGERVSAKEDILQGVNNPRQSEESIPPEESSAYCMGVHKGKGNTDAAWYGVSEPVCDEDGIWETGVEYTNPHGLRRASMLGGEAVVAGDCLHEQD